VNVNGRIRGSGCLAQGLALSQHSFCCPDLTVPGTHTHTHTHTPWTGHSAPIQQCNPSPLLFSLTSPISMSGWQALESRSHSLPSSAFPPRDQWQLPAQCGLLGQEMEKKRFLSSFCCLLCGNQASSQKNLDSPAIASCASALQSCGEGRSPR
jgi:hypothetical protein